ncbi:MAG: RNA polymerase sigma factor [Oligoflexales bacterium]
METQKFEKPLSHRSGIKKGPLTLVKKCQPKATGQQPEGKNVNAKNVSQPWLNPDGSEKGADELKRISECWKPSDWENYLASTETYLREEYLKKGLSVEKVAQEDYTAALVEILHLEEYPALSNEVQRIVGNLNPRHRAIIHLRYWENKTLQEIAEIVGISRQGVEKALRTSHKRIEERLRIIAAKNACIEMLRGPSK